MLLTPVISPVASSPISNSPTFHTLPSASTPRAGGPFAELEPLAVDGTISTLGTQQKTKGLSDKSIPIQSQASTKRQSHQATADSCGGAALGEEAEPSEYSAGLEESACTKNLDNESTPNRSNDNAPAPEPPPLLHASSALAPDGESLVPQFAEFVRDSFGLSGELAAQIACDRQIASSSSNAVATAVSSITCMPGETFSASPVRPTPPSRKSSSGENDKRHDQGLRISIPSTGSAQHHDWGELTAKVSIEESPPAALSERSDDEGGTEEEDDPDTHPLYLLLSTSLRPLLRRAWDDSTLILVPPRRLTPDLTALAQLNSRQASYSSFSSVPLVESPSKGFEFVRGAKGVAGEQRGRDAEADRERQRSEVAKLERWATMHAFRFVDSEGTAEGAGSRTWRSIGGGDISDYVVARLEPATGQIVAEWITSAQSDSSTRPPCFSPIGACVSSDSEASSLLPHTPPSPVHIPIQPTSDELDAFKRGANIDPSPRLPVPIIRSDCEATPTQATAPPFPATPTQTFQLVRSSALRIVSETTIYRRPRPPPSPLTPPIMLAPPIVMPKSSRSGFKAPKWLRRASPLKTLPEIEPKPSRPPQPVAVAAILQRVRVMQVDALLVPLDYEQRLPSGPVDTSSLSVSRHSTVSTSGGLGRGRANSTASTRSGRSGWSSTAHSGGGMTGQRAFEKDLAFLATPPIPLLPLSAVFASTLALIRSLVKDFENSFAYIKGFDSYTVQRIRKGIYDKVWLQFFTAVGDAGDVGAKALSDDADDLQQILENVIMGFLFQKLYVKSIQPLFTSENAMVNHILRVYRQRTLTPADLGVDLCDFGQGDALRAAIASMSTIGPPSTDSKPLVPELVQACCTIFGEERSVTTQIISSARTPLGCISSMRQAIEDIVEAVKTVEHDLRVAPDDLIPLLAWVLVKSNAVDLESLLFWIKTFRLSEGLAPEYDWSFVTFQASLAFLLSDPLCVLDDFPLPKPVRFVPFPTSSPNATATRPSADAQNHRPRRGSAHLQQSPYASPDQRRSPPASPRSIRTISSAWESSPVAEISSTLASNSDRQRRHLERFERRAVESADLPATTRSSARDRSSSADRDAMPPPTWTASTRQTHSRRRSLGVLSSGSAGPGISSEPTRAPHGTHRAVSNDARARSISPDADLQIRPRIVLPSTSTAWAQKRQSLGSISTLSAPPLVRSQSGLPASRQIGAPSPASADMGRTGSHDSPSIRRSYAEVWSLWGAATPSEDASTPQAPASPAAGDGATMTRAEDQSWWIWGRERLNSVGPGLALTRTQSGTKTDGPSALDENLELSPPSGSQRARRHSISTVESNAPPRAHLTGPLPPSSARLAAILAARNGGFARPRPRSIVSISSLSSFESGASHGTSTEESAASHLESSTTSLPAAGIHRRKMTKSRTWRELPISNMASKPLAPRLDSSAVLSLSSTSDVSTVYSTRHGHGSLPASPLQRRHTDF